MTTPVLASTSLVNLRAIKEAEFGVTPVTGNSTAMRVTGESLSFDITKSSSNEINSSRTVNSAVATTAKASGGINLEMHYAGIEPMLASAMQSDFVEFGTNGLGVATATTAITTTTITAASATSGTSIFTGLQLGQWFSISSAGANNGNILRVSTSVAPTDTVITLDASTPATASTGESIQVQSARLTHGTTKTSWSMEVENSDISTFICYKGMTPDKFNLKVASGSFSEMTFDFVGKNAVEGATTAMPGTPVAAPTYEIHSGVSGATNAIWMNGVPVTGTYVKSVTLDFGNSLRSREAIGTLGAVSVGSGTIACTLAMSIYFADKDTFTAFRSNTNTSISFASTDPDGNGYIFTVPKGSITAWKSNASGKDQDQMVDLTYTALNDNGNAVAALRKLLFVDRVGAAVV